jgi:hypothetical protein
MSLRDSDFGINNKICQSKESINHLLINEIIFGFDRKIMPINKLQRNDNSIDLAFIFISIQSIISFLKRLWLERNDNFVDDNLLSYRFLRFISEFIHFL